MVIPLLTSIVAGISLSPLISLIAGILILIMPRLLNFIVAIYLIIIGLVGVFHLLPQQHFTGDLSRQVSLTTPAANRGRDGRSPFPSASAERIIGSKARSTGKAGSPICAENTQKW